MQDAVRRFSDVNITAGALSSVKAGGAAEAPPPALDQHVWWNGSRLGGGTATAATAPPLTLTATREGFPAFDVETNIRNCWLATAAILGVAPTATTLRPRLVQALNELQRSCIPCDPDAVVVTFENQALLEVMRREGLVETAALDDDRRYRPDEQARIADRIRDAFEYIRAVDPILHDLVASMVPTIACIRREGTSGSLSSLIGVIWLNPSDDWTVVDYAECIVHEFIHTSIFVEDLVHGVFAKPHFSVSPDALVMSAILKYPRGFNISFHSAYVAAGLTIFLRAAEQAERAAEVGAGLPETVNQLRRIEAEHLTEHGREWFAALAA